MANTIKNKATVWMDEGTTYAISNEAIYTCAVGRHPDVTLEKLPKTIAKMISNKPYEIALRINNIESLIATSTSEEFVIEDPLNEKLAFVAGSAKIGDDSVDPGKVVYGADNVLKIKLDIIDALNLSMGNDITFKVMLKEEYI